jgi:hypothetical protein
MRARKLQLIGILSLSVLSACASLSIHQPLSTAARGDLTTTDVVLPIRQSEIYVFVPMTQAAAGGGGLIGALIAAGVDSVRTSKAETAITPLRNAMVDYRFDAALQEELKTSFAQIAWIHPANFEVIRDISNDGLGKTLAASKAASVLFVVTEYSLSNDGDALLVVSEAALMPNNDQLRALIPGKRDTKTPVSLNNALYRNRIVFEAHVTASGDRDRNIAEWSANNASATRAALTMATKKIAALVADDVQRAEGDIAPAANASQVKISVPAESAECASVPVDAQCATSAALLSQDQDGEILRFKDGSLKYLKLTTF